MIIHENYKENLVKTYSDKGNYIKKSGKTGKYEVAYDVKPLRYTYVETDEKIIKVKEKELTYEEELEALKKKYRKE